MTDDVHVSSVRPLLMQPTLPELQKGPLPKNYWYTTTLGYFSRNQNIQALNSPHKGLENYKNDQISILRVVTLWVILQPTFQLEAIYSHLLPLTN